MKSITSIAIRADSKEDALTSVEIYIDDNVDFGPIDEWKIVDAYPLDILYDALYKQHEERMGNGEDIARSIIRVAQEYIDGKASSCSLCSACNNFCASKSSRLNPLKEYYNIDAEYDSDGIPSNHAGWYIVKVWWKY